MEKGADDQSAAFLPYLLEIQMHQYMEALADSLRLALSGGDRDAMTEVGERIRRIRGHYNAVAARNGLPDIETALKERCRHEGDAEIPY